MWLSREVLSWRPKRFASAGYGDEIWRRAYQIWEHAEHLLDSQCSDFHLVDSITTLKRAINHRLQQLDSMYHFRELFPDQSPKRVLEQLSYFRLLKPLMLQNLILIRNKVEHDDLPPPSQDRCREFLELTWYFLRSTDKLLSDRIASFTLNPIEGDGTDKYYWVNIESGAQGELGFRISGWVQPSLVSSEPIENWLYIELNRTEKKEQLLKRVTKEELEFDMGHGGRGLNVDDLYFDGRIDGPMQHVREIYQIYFSTQ